MATARASQSNLFDWLIKDGNDKHMSGESVNISDMHRMAAKHQLDRGADRLPWFHVYDFAEVKDCIACGKQINMTAIRCEHCTTMLPQFYMEFGVEPENDKVVSDFIARIKASRVSGVVVAPEATAPAAPPATIEPEPQKDSRAAGQPKK